MEIVFIWRKIMVQSAAADCKLLNTHRLEKKILYDATATCLVIIRWCEHAKRRALFVGGIWDGERPIQFF